jgi:hypothetical protein
MTGHLFASPRDRGSCTQTSGRALLAGHVRSPAMVCWPYGDALQLLIRGLRVTSSNVQVRRHVPGGLCALHGIRPWSVRATPRRVAVPRRTRISPENVP